MNTEVQVLVVEDNPGDARLAQEMLRQPVGLFQVKVAETLASAVQELAGEAADLVLLDLGLPDSRGFETLTAFQALYPELPVVVMTASDDEELGARTVQLGAQDYLVKGKTNAPLLRRSLMYAVERKRAQEALKRTEEFLERMVEVNPAIMSVTDVNDGRIIYASRAGLSALGYSRTANLVPAMFYPGDFERMSAVVDELRGANNGGARELEVRVKTANGEWRWLQIIHVIFKRDSQGQPQQIMRVARDITSHKELETALEARRSELEEVNQELRAFTYSVSHDLRAPLRQIGGFAKLLEEEAGGTLDEPSRRHLALIQDGTGRMSQLLEDLLGLSRLGRQGLHPQRCGLKSLVEEAVAELGSEAKGREVEWRIGELAEVRCDRTLVKQVLLNLLSNALKYTRPRRPAVIEVGQAELRGSPVFFVRDNGVGFDMKYADKLFGVFQRLHRAEEFEGSGIGLAIVQRIMHRHGGRVWAEAEVDRGATFYLSFPNCEKQEPEAAAA